MLHRTEVLDFLRFAGANMCSLPKCNDLRKFKLEREGNVGKDWCPNVLIKNKRRRDENGLYKSTVREKVLAS